MKIYQIKKGEEERFIAANTVIEAIIVHNEETFEDFREFDKTDDVIEIPESLWDHMTVINPEYDETNPEDWEYRTFRESILQMSQPGLIAMSDYE